MPGTGSLGPGNLSPCGSARCTIRRVNPGPNPRVQQADFGAQPSSHPSQPPHHILNTHTTSPEHLKQARTRPLSPSPSGTPKSGLRQTATGRRASGPQPCPRALGVAPWRHPCLLCRITITAARATADSSRSSDVHDAAPRQRQQPSQQPAECWCPGVVPTWVRPAAS